MNADVVIQQRLEDKFKAPFHKNMTLKDMVHVWSTLVPSSVKQEFPQIDMMFTTIDSVITEVDALQQLYLQAKTTYSNLQLTIETAAGILTGNPNATVLAASVAAQQAKDAGAEGLNQLLIQLFDLMMAQLD